MAPLPSNVLPRSGTPTIATGSGKGFETGRWRWSCRITPPPRPISKSCRAVTSPAPGAGSGRSSCGYKRCGPVQAGVGWVSRTWRIGSLPNPPSWPVSDRKGAIAAGRDADFVVFDPDDSTPVRGRDLEHRHPITPYDGMTLRGSVVRTILRGDTVFDSGAFTTGSGRMLVRDG